MTLAECDADTSVLSELNAALRNSKGATLMTYLTVLVHVVEDRTVLSSKEALHFLLILPLHAHMLKTIRGKKFTFHGVHHASLQLAQGSTAFSPETLTVWKMLEAHLVT